MKKLTPPILNINDYGNHKLTDLKAFVDKALKQGYEEYDFSIIWGYYDGVDGIKLRTIGPRK